MDIKAKVEDLNRLVQEGRALDAFEKYYADDVVMQEDAQDPVVGKDANRAREEAFFSGVTQLRAAELKRVAVGDDVTMCEWHFDYTHREWGDVAYDQIAVQRWRDGRIVEERFFKAA